MMQIPHLSYHENKILWLWKFVMGYQEISFSTGVVLYVVEKIVDPLAKLQHGFAAFISADKILPYLYGRHHRFLVWIHIF